MKMTMHPAALAVTIAVIGLGIYDLIMVAFFGAGSSVSDFLINAGFKDPVIVFAFGFIAGHLFGYMRPEKEYPDDVR